MAMNKTQITTYWQSLPWDEIKLKTNTHLPKLVLIILIVLITQTFAKLTWQLFTPAENMSVATSRTSIPNKQTPDAASKLEYVSAYHLFGNANKQVVVKEKVIDAPETRLRLDLKGVFASSRAKSALAIISSSKGKDKTYHIGDKVTSGVLLHAIYSDRVILKRNNKLETLRLPKSKVDSKAFYTPETAAPSKARSSSLSSGRQIKSQTKRLRKIRDTLLKDPEKLWQQVRINPVMKNGQVKGYTLAHNDKAMMKALNLKKSDVITAVNGLSLSDPATLYGLMGSLSSQSSLELSIERDGQSQTIQLSF